MASVNALDMTKLSIKKYVLDVPCYDDIAKVFESNLCQQFESVICEVVECPDLKVSPFKLASSGLAGNCCLLDIGGPSNIFPLVDRSKVYDLRSVSSLTGDEQSFIIGAGAGPWPYIGTNCEYTINCVVNKTSVVTSENHVIKLGKNGKSSVVVEKIPQTEFRYALLANIFSCRGECDKVIKVHAKKRIGNDDFVTLLRKALEYGFPDKTIGMGGTFLVGKGKTRVHVMPQFSETPIKSEADVDEWLAFFNVDAPQVFVGTLVSKDPDLDLRVQHFHGHGECDGGHYHYDTTPDDIEYLAYFSCGETILRVDMPPSAANQIGFN